MIFNQLIVIWNFFKMTFWNDLRMIWWFLEKNVWWKSKWKFLSFFEKILKIFWKFFFKFFFFCEIFLKYSWGNVLPGDFLLIFAFNFSSFSPLTGVGWTKWCWPWRSSSRWWSCISSTVWSSAICRAEACCLMSMAWRWSGRRTWWSAVTGYQVVPYWHRIIIQKTKRCNNIAIEFWSENTGHLLNLRTTLKLGQGNVCARMVSE